MVKNWFWLILLLAACKSENTSQLESPVSAEKVEALPTPEFDWISNQVGGITDEQEKTVETLAPILAAIGQSEMGKLRALYCWISDNLSYNGEIYDGGTHKLPTAQDVLDHRNVVCTGFATLAKKLADQMGLQMVVVHGFAKGLNYDVAGDFTEYGHVWNAAMVDDEWKLIDFTWGQGYSKTEEGRTVSVAAFDEKWFCTEPAKFAPTHFPFIEKWQCLEDPLTEGEFRRIPMISPEFFQESISGDSLLNVLRGRFLPVVEVFPQYDLELLSVPVFNKLEEDTTYAFSLRSDSAVGVMLHEIRTDQRTEFEKQKNVFSLEHEISTRDTVGVVVEYPNESLYYLLYNSKKSP